MTFGLIRSRLCGVSKRLDYKQKYDKECYHRCIWLWFTVSLHIVIAEKARSYLDRSCMNITSRKQHYSFHI